MTPAFFPQPEEYMQGRIFSLDLLRGIDIFFLTVVCFLFRGAKFTFDFPPEVIYEFRHPFLGFTVLDMVMPLFIFMCGAAIPFGLRKHLSGGRAMGTFWCHVLARVGLLWVVGTFIQGNLMSLDPRKFLYFYNTLHQIGFCYLVTAVIMQIKRPLVRLLIPVTLIVGGGIFLHFNGDYSMAGTAAHAVDRRVISWLVPPDYAWAKLPGPIFMPALANLAICLAGFETAELLRSSACAWRKVAVIGVVGTIAIVAAWLVRIWVPFSKKIGTPSFTLQAIGICMLMLGALYALTDIARHRRGMGLFLLFGRHSLLAYFFYGYMFWDMEMSFLGFFTYGLPEPYRMFAGRCVAVALLTLLLAARRRWVLCGKEAGS